MFCPYCGAEIADGSSSCAYCGAEFEEDFTSRKGTESSDTTQLGKPRIDPDIFIHDLDRAALNALKKIPGFTSILKAFMKVFSERAFRITNMSSRIRLDENQMQKYYDMLLPICEKLSIDVPDLYIELDVDPNAYTQGDLHPFIVMTSGLLETIPEDLLPTVLAHECGHILCHHVLYQTMGALILNGFSFMIGASSLVTKPLEWAFAYWIRCSEFSADRVAMVCDGSPDKMLRLCAYFAGYNKDFNADLNMDAFMEQAEEYNKLIKSSMWDKSLEFFLYNQNSHPLTAVRAYEGNKWSQTAQYAYALRLVNPD